MNEKQLAMVKAAIDACITSPKEIANFIAQILIISINPKKMNDGFSYINNISLTKIKIDYLFFSFILAFSSHSVFAKIDENNILKNYPGISNEYKICIDQYIGNNTQAGYCISEETMVQNTRLNTTYKKLFSILNKSQKKKLVLAQTAWINQQKKESDFQISLYKKGDLISNLEIATLELFKLCERVDRLNKAINVVNEYK